MNQTTNFNDSNYYNFYRTIEKQQQQQSLSVSSGLFSNDFINNVFQLTDFSIKTEINDTCLTQFWTQTYDNKSKTPIEAIYKLPLHPKSVISNFIVEYQDKILNGKIKEKEKASEKYSDTIANGNTAFLGEKTIDGYFILKIGNLPPNEKVIIRIVITSELGTQLNLLHYFIHNSMFPKSSKFSFDLNVKLKLSTPIKSITCDKMINHTLTYDTDDKKEATIISKEFNSINGDNILIIIETIETDTPKSIIEYNPIDKSYAMLINYYPNFFKDIKSDEINQKSEYIFLVDCSGSMSGSAISSARSALEIIIRSLSETNKMNIYCFGSTFIKAFPSSVLYNDETLDQVSQFIDENVLANLGGTELLKPLQDILSKPIDQEYPRQVFILTDGEVDKRNNLIDYVSKEVNTTRFFTLGIGNTVDKDLIIGLSCATNGYYTLIENNNEIETKVMELLNISFEPMLSNIKIDWSSFGLSNNDTTMTTTTTNVVIQASSKIRPLFNKERMIIYSLLLNSNEIIESSKKNNKPIIITLTGDGPKGNQLSFPLTLDFNQNITNTTSIHTIAAFKHIQDLEESELKENKDHRDKIVEFGKKYGLVSKYTSFIISADNSDHVTHESMNTINIMDTLNQRLIQSVYSSRSFNNSSIRGGFGGGRGGFGGGRGGGHGGSRVSISDLDAESNSSSRNREQSIAMGSIDDDEDENSQCYSKKRKSSNRYSKLSYISKDMFYIVNKNNSNNSNSNNNNNDLLINLLKCQKANGSWIKSSITKFNFTSIDEYIPTQLSSNSDIWITIYIIAKINKLFISEKSKFELSIQKSIKWVKLQLTKSNITLTFDQLLSIANSIV